MKYRRGARLDRVKVSAPSPLGYSPPGGQASTPLRLLAPKSRGGSASVRRCHGGRGGSASTCRATAFDKTVGEILVGAIAGEEFEDCDAGAGTAHPNRERSGVSRTTGQGSR